MAEGEGFETSARIDSKQLVENARRSIRKNLTNRGFYTRITHTDSIENSQFSFTQLCEWTVLEQTVIPCSS
jgi:hypothetical protein